MEYFFKATEAGMRLDQFVANALDRSRSFVQKHIQKGVIRVNQQVAKSSYIVQVDDAILVQLDARLDIDAPLPQDIPLNIVYEDPYLLVINKPAHMVVHPDEHHKTATLANALVYRYPSLPLKDGVVTRPGLVHRIDKDTSGLLVVAKTEASLAHLEKQFYHHTIERVYYALVWGDLTSDSGTISYPVSKGGWIKKNKPICKNPKPAITHYRVVRRIGGYVTLVVCSLETGRTHQVRIHMQKLGHPVFGDPLYGGTKIVIGQPYTAYQAFIKNCMKLLGTQALHATLLGFIHPILGHFVSYTLPLPESFRQVIHKWQRYLVTSKDRLVACKICFCF